jgi:hypothetical protein
MSRNARSLSLIGIVGAVVALAAVSVVVGSKYKTTSRASEVGPTSFAGKKVAAVVISDHEALRVSSEEALVRELAGRGICSLPKDRLIWAGVSEAKHPETVQKVVTDLVRSAAKSSGSKVSPRSDVGTFDRAGYRIMPHASPVMPPPPPAMIASA